MRLYKTTQGTLLQTESQWFQLTEDWDLLVNRRNLHAWLADKARQSILVSDTQANELINSELLAPIGSQEVWAAGVTYLRSRDARMEESKASGGADFYDKVYMAERPELFFKANPGRVAAHNQEVYIRRDSTWNVPEPELTLYINRLGEIQGYTIGNDMSSRSIEGENPLYLPQAKVYEKSAALGPCLYVPSSPISRETTISIIIRRLGQVQFEDTIQLNKMKRSLAELASYLYRECVFPQGCLLMTGTGMVPPPDFTLLPEDDVDIAIEAIGTLHNRVAMGD
jgi:2-dehydro-3-deoxy-D-arabinonate dehydratase